MVSAYVGKPYKLVFPLLSKGYLNLDYDKPVTHPDVEESTGVLVNNGSGIGAGTTTTIAVDTVDATTKFAVGDTVYDDTGASVGIVSVVAATQITLAANNSVALANNENLKKNISSTATTRLRPLWAHSDSFTMEVLFTPYDVNGIGSNTSGRHGVLDSIKTPPYPNDTISSRASTYESVAYLGEGASAAYLTHKLMLFYNTNLKLYLQNTTTSSYNQPAEYKIVAELTSGSTTKTITTDTVIKPVNTLRSFYDSSGYYSNHNTSYQRISASATGSNPQGTVTISGYSSLPVDVKATGQIVVSGTPTHYVSPVNATGSVTIANESNFKVDVTASGSTGGHVKFGAIPDSAVHTDTTEYIQITNEEGSVVTKWFAVDGATNGAALTGGSWPAGARAYTRSTDAPTIATNLAAAINSYDDGWKGSASAGPDPLDTSFSPPSNTVVFTGGIGGSAPNRKGADGDITLGSGLPGAVTRVQISGGANELILGESTGSADSNINYISITDSAGTTKNYFPSETNTTGSTGTRTLDDSSTVSVVYFNWGGNSQESNCAEALKTAINHANGHPSTITATRSNAVVNLSHDIIGTAGNSATIVKTNTADNAATISGANFTGGTNQANNSNTPYIELTDAAGSAVTKKYVPVANGDAIATSATQTIGSVSGAVAFQVGADATATAANLETAIEHANGHNGSILVSNSSGTLTLTQNIAGTAGNTNINQNNLANVADTDFSNGATPDAYISITDSQGTLRKYKADTTRANGTSANGYVYFKRETNNNTTTANLEVAIDSTNGHNGTIITTDSSNVLTCKLNVPAMGSAAIALAGISSGASVSNFSATNNNNVEVSSGEATEIGKGNKIYDSSTTLIGTVASVSTDTITLDDTPATNITSIIYTEQPKEALYLEDMFKVTLVYHKTGSVELWLNNELLVKDSHTLGTMQLHASDCQIGRGASNAEQFFGELFEISMSKNKNPSATLKTLLPGYSDILFYYNFGGLIMGALLTLGKVIFPLNAGISEATITEGATYDYDSHTDHETKAYTDVSINPVFVQNNVKYENNIEHNTTGYDVIKNSANFMEIRNTSRATSISNDGTDRIGNRLLPTDETLSTYGNCNEETPSHKIKVMDAEITTTNSVTNRKFIYSTTNYPNSDEVGLDVENYDYFILINPEIVEAGNDKVRPHFAKITRIVSFDSFGDGLEFTPSYPTAIPKNTKFEIYKGPAKTDTNVVAVSYGLRGDTSATTPKYDRVNICSLPTWYFYNDRLDEKNQLDYMTKYTATHLRWWENTTTVITDIVGTLQQWEAGSTSKYYELSHANWKKLVEGQSIWKNADGTLLGNIAHKYSDGSDYRFYLDYARQTINAFGTGSQTNKVGKTAVNVVFRTEAKFDNTIQNLGKDKLNAYLVDTNRSDDYNITDAHKWNNIFPKMHRHTANLIIDTTHSMDGNLTGPSKYITFEKAGFKNNKLPLIQSAELNSPRNKMSQLASFRTLDSSGIAHLKIKEDDDLIVQNHIYTTSLKYYSVEGKASSVTGTADNIEMKEISKEFDLRHKLSADDIIEVDGYLYVVHTVYAQSGGTQKIKVKDSKLKSASTWSGSTNVHSISQKTLYVPPYTGVLNFDLASDTEVEYATNRITIGGVTIDKANTKLNGARVVFGNNNSHDNLLDVTDKNNYFAKVQDSDRVFYQRSNESKDRFYYYTGGYAISDTAFNGAIENVSSETNSGMTTYAITGRDETSKLISQTIDKNTAILSDIHYSSHSPIVDNVTDLSVGTISVSGSVLTYGGTTSGVVLKPFGILLNHDGKFVGEVKSYTTSPKEITLFRPPQATFNNSGVNLKYYHPYAYLSTDTTHTTYITGTKALGSNPDITSTQSDLSVSGKGLVFDGGLRIIPPDTAQTYYTNSVFTTENLVGTSNTGGILKDKTLGYDITSPKNIDANDSNFAIKVGNENGISFTHNSIGTVKQETFDVVSTNEKIEGTTIISIAPKFPVVMGRIGSNTSDTRGNCSLYFVNSDLNTGGFLHRLGVGNSYADHVDGECIRYWDFQNMIPGTITKNYDSIYNVGKSPQKIQGYAVGYGVRANGSKISVTNSNTNRPINGSNTLDGWNYLGNFYSPYDSSTTPDTPNLIKSYYPNALNSGDPFEYDIDYAAFEQIDSRTDYYDWFAVGDLFPASSNRNNNLGYHTLNYENFSMLLETEGEEKENTTIHEEYVGTTAQTVKSENNYEAVSISSATQTTNQISRFGVIRLVEATFDWHFNPVDLESTRPSDRIPTIPYFDYVMFENPDELSGKTIQLRETDGANVNVSNTNITENTLSLGDMFYTTDYMGSNSYREHTSISGSPNQINGFIAVKESGSVGSFNTDSGNNNLIDATTLDGSGYTETFNDIWQFDGYDAGGTIKYYGVQPFYVYANRTFYLDGIHKPHVTTDHATYNRTNRRNDFRFTDVYITRPFTHTGKFEFANLEDNSEAFSAHNIILPLITGELTDDSTYENKEISPFHHPDNWANQDTNWLHTSRVINALVGAKFGADSGPTITHKDKYGLGHGTYPFAHPYEGCIGVFKDIRVAMHGNTVDPGNIEVTSAPLALDTNANYVDYVAEATNANLDQHDRNVQVAEYDANNTVAMIGTRTELHFLSEKQAISTDVQENHHTEFASDAANEGLVVSAQMLVKPVFELKSNVSSGNYTVGGTDASLSFPNGTNNSIGDTMVFVLNNASKHTFLSFLPNLTGYYLVSEEKVNGGTLRNTSRIEPPRAMTRITSHTVSTAPTTSNTETHTIKIDVPLNTQHSTNHRFRLMRPSEVTFNGEEEYIRFNTMEPIDSFTNSSFLTGESGGNKEDGTANYHYSESVYQMFLLLDVDGVPQTDNTLFSAGYTNFMNRNDYNNSTIDIRHPSQAAYKFKRTGTTLVQKKMNVTDGQTSSVKNITFSDFIPLDREIGLTFDTSQNFTKMAGLTMKFDGKLYGNGVVSFGEVFDVSLSRRPKLKNIKKCHIGTGFTVASNVSEEVENLVKEVNLEYDDLRSFIIPTGNIVSSTTANTVVCSATPENIATGDVLFSHDGHLIGEIQGISSQTITFTTNLKFTPIQHDEVIKINKKTYVSSLKFDDVNLFTAINALAVKNGLDYNIRNGKFTARNIEDTSSLRKFALSYKESDRLISVENNTSLFDSANKAIIIGDRVKYELERPIKGQTRAIKEIDPSIKTKTDAEIRAVELLSLHNSDSRKITIKVHKKGLELLEAGDIVRLNFPNHNIPIGDYIVFEITNVLAGVLTMVVGTFDKTIAERLSELNTKQSDGFSSLFKKDAIQISAGKFLFDTISIKDVDVSYEITGSSNELSYNSNMGFDDLVGFTEEVGFEHSTVTKKSYANKFYEQEDYGGLSE